MQKQHKPVSLQRLKQTYFYIESDAYIKIGEFGYDETFSYTHRALPMRIGRPSNHNFADAHLSNDLQNDQNAQYLAEIITNGLSSLKVGGKTPPGSLRDNHYMTVVLYLKYILASAGIPSVIVFVESDLDREFMAAESELMGGKIRPWVKKKIVKKLRENTYGHAVLAVKLNNTWYFIDPHDADNGHFLTFSRRTWRHILTDNEFKHLGMRRITYLYRKNTVEIYSLRELKRRYGDRAAVVDAYAMHNINAPAALAFADEIIERGRDMLDADTSELRYILYGHTLDTPTGKKTLAEALFNGDGYLMMSLPWSDDDAHRFFEIIKQDDYLEVHSYLKYSHTIGSVGFLRDLENTYKQIAP